ERTVKAGDTVIDVGTGSGVLSIGAALLGASNVQALDLDEVAVRSARENIELNQVGNIVTVGQNNLLQGIEGPVDIVVANILAEVIVRFVDDAAKVLKPGGMFITSGIISAKKEDVKKALTGAGFVIQEVTLMEDWVAIIAQKQA
ncbi:MAG: 50S ribosomal protein L11 methyltransferase, partial [Priestia megaterium]